MNVNHANTRWGRKMPGRHSFLPFALILTILLLWGTDGTPIYGAPPIVPQEQEDARKLIHQSAQATEQAWEEFHSAAIGGTLASPAVQANIERQLHEVRALLMEARKAERAKEFDSVNSLTEKIIQITQNIVQASREKKQ